MRKIGMVSGSVALAVGLLFFGYIGPTDSMRNAKAQTAPARNLAVMCGTHRPTNPDV